MSDRTVYQNNTFFSNEITRENFPTANNLTNILYNYNFNKLLTIIKDKIIIANMNNNNYIKLLNNDLLNILQNIINDVKTFLINNGYQIILVEDTNNINIGLKIQW